MVRQLLQAHNLTAVERSARRDDPTPPEHAVLVKRVQVWSIWSELQAELKLVVIVMFAVNQ
jgi:hypothetical protein